jgi:hypothetical protein
MEPPLLRRSSCSGSSTTAPILSDRHSSILQSFSSNNTNIHSSSGFGFTRHAHFANEQLQESLSAASSTTHPVSCNTPTATAVITANVTLGGSSGLKAAQTELYNIRCSRGSSNGRISRGSDSSNEEADLDIDSLQKQHAELSAKLEKDEALLQRLEADLFEARGNAASQKCLLQLVWSQHGAADEQVKQQTQQKSIQKHWWQCKATQQKKALQAGKAESVQLQGQRQRLQADLLKLNRQVRNVARATCWQIKTRMINYPSIHEYDADPGWIIKGHPAWDLPLATAKLRALLCLYCVRGRRSGCAQRPLQTRVRSSDGYRVRH